VTAAQIGLESVTDLNDVTNAGSGIIISEAERTNLNNAHAHTSLTSNPHSVTAAQIGLGDVENSALSTFTGSSNITSVGTLTSLNVTGNVGIGTTIPLAKLVIQGDATNTNQPTGIRDGNVQDTHTGLFLCSSGNAINEKYGLQFGGWAGWAHSGIFGVMDYQSGETTGDITFDFREASNDTSLTEKMRITHEGNVGIGDTTPSYKLDVNGDINLTGSLRINGTAQTFGGGSSIWTEASSEAYYAGNVGIGNTNPAYKLDVNGTGRFTGDLTSNGFTCSRLTTSVTGDRGSVQTRGTGEGYYDGYSIDGNFVFMAYNADDLYIYNDVDNQHIWRYHRTGQKHSFYVAGGEKMTIDSNGNVGIGQSINLQHKLHVNGTSKFMDNLTCIAGFSCSGLTTTITGSRGSIETKEIYNRWAGYSIDGNFVFTAWDANNLYIYNDVDDQNIWRYDRTNSRHSFYNAGSTKMTIDSSGNVGIGDSTPSYKLDVAGDINLTGSLRINGTAQTFGGSVWTEASSEAYYAGNVGIGTNNPDKKLHILGSSNEIAHFERDDGNAATIKFSNTASSEGAIIGLSSTEHFELANLKTNKDIILKTNNTERIRVDNGGNVGIGDSSPTYKLDVNGTGRFTGDLTCDSDFIVDTDKFFVDQSTGNVGIGTDSPDVILNVIKDQNAITTMEIENNTSNSNAGVNMTLNAGNKQGRISLMAFPDNFSTSGCKLAGSGLLWCENENLNGLVIGTGSSTGIKFYGGNNAEAGNATELMRIDSSGNVGIGDTSPSYKLDVNGTGRFTGDLTCSGDFITNKLLLEGGSSQYPYIEAKGAGNPKGIGFFTENTEKMRIHKNGNVGIGTDNPQELIHIRGNSNPSIRIENSLSGSGSFHQNAEYGSVDFWTSDGNQATARIVAHQMGSGTQPDCGLKFYTNLNSAVVNNMTIDPAGNVQIGNNSTDDVRLFIQTDDGLVCKMYSNTSGNNTADIFRASSNVGGTGAVKFILEADGDCINTNNNYGQISDVRLKENVINCNSQWEDMKKIRFVNYNFKNTPDKCLLGVIADEIEIFSKGLVKNTGRSIKVNGEIIENVKEVKTSIIYMKGMKALQEALLRIEILEEKIKNIL
jgi:hypothetical protein